MGSLLNTRTNRATHWLILLICAALLAAVLYFTEQRIPGEVALIFACVPRLHDIGWSGWWVAAMILGEIVSVVAGLLLVPLGQGELLIGAYLLLLLGAVLIALGLVPGQRRANRCGRPPGPGLSFGRPAADPGETFSCGIIIPYQDNRVFSGNFA